MFELVWSLFNYVFLIIVTWSKILITKLNRTLKKLIP